MGWRDRDYAKFNDEERRAFLGDGRGRRLPPSQEGLTHPGHSLRPAPRRALHARRRFRRRTNPVVLLAAAVSLAAVMFVGYVKNVPILHDLLAPSLAPTSAPRQVAPPPVVTPAPSSRLVAPSANVVSITWRSQDLAPAPNAGRICVTDATHGRTCASYVVGERPAHNLTRELERRGFQVQSSGWSILGPPSRAPARLSTDEGEG